MITIPFLGYGAGFFDWVTIFLGLLVAVFGVIIFLQNTQKPNSRGFFFFALSVGGWGVVSGLFSAGFFATVQPLLVTTFYITGALIPTIAVFFLQTTMNEESAFKSTYAAALLLPYLFITVVLSATDFMVSYQAVPSGAVGEILLGKGYMFYVAYLVLCFVSALVFLAKMRHKSVATEVRELAASTVFGTTAVIVVTLLLPFHKTINEIFQAGQILVVAYLVLIGFTVIKKNDWNLKLVATQFVVAMVIIMLSVELFFATSTTDLVVKTAIMLAVLFASSFLEKSMLRETESQEKIEQLLDKLEETNQSLKTLDRKKSEFLVIAAHHLRDPLTVINGYASMFLEGSFGNISREMRDALEKIFESGKRLVTMVSDFMDISHIESGDMQYEFTDVDMKKLVLDLGAEMRISAKRSSLVFEVLVHAPPEESFLAVADYEKIRQVASNLMDNAIKYTPKGSVFVHLSKSVDSRRIILSITDSGIGMSKATLEKIFKKFSRAEGVSKVYTEGSGLGLYVAKEIMKKHDGKIWAESAGEGYGATFFIELAAKGREGINS